MLLAAPAFVIVAVAAGFLPLLAFASAHGGSVVLDAYTWRVVGFTVAQATLSTVIAIVLALPAARAMAFRSFPGRNVLMALFAVPQALPAIVVVLALVELYGQAGWFGGMFSVYGLAGILLAHVFFNLPLALRFFVEALESVQPENVRLGEQLGFSTRARWRHVEWPALRPIMPRVAALIFLLCAASFVVVLTLGGPSATTLEVAIYQSLRLDFDVSRAVTLSLLQVALCGALVVLAGQAASPSVSAPRLRNGAGTTAGMGWFNGTMLALATLLVLPPLAALLVSGVTHFNPRPVLLQALVTSLLITFLSACICTLLAWPIALLQVRWPRHRGWLVALSLLGLIVPPAVLATGWFILISGIGSGAGSSVALIAGLNALMALPFAVNLLAAAMADVMPNHDRLCAQLGLAGWQRLRLVDGPALARPLAQGFLMAFVLSFGDLTAVMLLGSQGLITLPSLIASEMGQFRSDNAQGTALLLAALCLAGSLLANRLSRPESRKP
jgi:thiamine transport system permease protein